MYRSIIVRSVLASFFLLGIETTDAFAGSTTNAQANNNQIQAEVQTSTKSTLVSTTGTTAVPVCTSSVIDPNQDGLFVVGEDDQVKPLFDDDHKATDGRWLWETCTTGPNTSTARTYWLPNANPIDLARSTLATTPLPTPVIPMAQQPKTYVNADTWLWIDANAWKPVSASASLGGVTVTVIAQPIAVVWDSGDAKATKRTTTCNGPGAPLGPTGPTQNATSDCTIRYAHTSGQQPGLTFPLSATLQWRATWTSSSGASGNLGVVSRTATVPISVGEWQVLNKYPDEGP